MSSISVGNAQHQSMIKQRRKCIPFRPQNAAPNYMTLLKGIGVGRDLSKTAMPVEFNEPLSMLQRQTEELEYALLLDLAALEEADSARRTALVCTFAISGYSTLGSRPTKPFNPLLGETYECDRRADRGWRSLAEQISHHPPGSALHAEGTAWTLEQHYVFESKLKGTAICLQPIGLTHIRFRDGQTFVYQKLPTMTSLDSIMNGGTTTKNGSSSPSKSANSADCSGQLTVTALATGERGQLTFHAGKKGSQRRSVTGSVVDAQGQEQFRLEAVWDSWARIGRVGPSGETEEWEMVWTADELPADSQRMHGFTRFAIELNEEEPGVAPTDSRRRPDQRLCELGEFGAANRLKRCLEEAQRQRLRERQQRDSSPHRPLWFIPIRRNENGNDDVKKSTAETKFMFTGDYWKVKATQSWDVCPELFAV